MYDVAIIGAGLSGLECAYLLAKEGMKVIVLEKQHFIGGCLQTFKRRGLTFDTGFHYVGGLDEGQPLNRIFSEFGLMDLPWQKMDADCFDEVIFKGKSYKFKNGYDEFLAQMTEYFPNQKQNLNEYVSHLRNVGDNIFKGLNRSIEELNSDFYFSNFAHPVLSNMITDSDLLNVLSGTSPKMSLTDKLPLYHFMQINASFIQSAWRIKGGGMQIAEKLASSIRAMGGEVVTDAKVTKLVGDTSKITTVEIENREPIEVKNVICNAHPKILMDLIEGVSFVRNFQKRSAKKANSFGMFTANIALKPGKLKYQNKNIYIHESGDVWTEGSQKASDKPTCALVSFAIPKEGEFAENVDILTPMLWDDVKDFEGSKPMQRPDQYNEMKAQKASQLLDIVEQHVPGIKDAVEHIYTSTPLTYKDYTGTIDGSAYGLLEKIINQQFASNIYLTGQSNGLHGFLGVSMTSLLTVNKLTGKYPEALIKQ